MQFNNINLGDDLLRLVSGMELSTKEQITLDTELTGINSVIESIEYVQIIAVFEDYFEEKGQTYDLFELSMQFKSFTIRALSQHIYQNS